MIAKTLKKALAVLPDDTKVKCQDIFILAYFTSMTPELENELFKLAWRWSTEFQCYEYWV